MANQPTKKTTKKVEQAPADGKSDAPRYIPKPEDKSKATTLRIVAAVLWLLAIGGEAFEIFYVLRQNPISMVWLIAGLVVIAVLAIAGSLLWQKANRLDPAPRAQAVRFFVQNQLGAIVTIIAFVPLIVLILLNKDMSTKQKGIAGGIGIALVLVAGFFGIDRNPVSAEEYADEVQAVAALTGVAPEDVEVCWVTKGTVYHLCADVSDLQQESKDNTITCGSVGQAHAAGMQRLTLKTDQEVRQCGFDVAAATAGATEAAEEPTDEPT